MHRAAIFVVERYLPGTSLGEISRRLERVRATTDVTDSDFIRHVGSIFIPEEESCICLFEASSANAVGDANRQANFEFARVIPGVHLKPT